MSLTVTAPVSVGELIDKITILEIKLARFADAAKRANVAVELSHLQAVATREAFDGDPRIVELKIALKQVNEILWDLEERIRRCEDAAEFGSIFIAIARAVYRTNDERAGIKHRINIVSGSALIEEKSY